MCVFGIYTNIKKDEELRVTKKLAETLERRGVTFFYDEAVGKKLGASNICYDKKVDVLFVLGGDGTMLTATRHYSRDGAKLLGINLGRVGFMMDLNPDHFEMALDAVIAGDYEFESRIMLCTEVTNKEGLSVKTYALNEAVLAGCDLLRMIDIAVSVNDVQAYRISCDGIIVSTPTGSTGYSLSAGGSVVLPTLDLMLLTPICSHSLMNCKSVIAGDDVVTLKLLDGSKRAALTLDGKMATEITSNETIIIRKAEFSAKFIRMTDKSFFDLLRDKLTEWTN